MKINNNLISYFPKNSFVEKSHTNVFSAIEKQDFKSVPLDIMKAYSFGISVKKREDIYSDTSKFAEYFFNKIQTKLQVISEEDVQNIIDNTVKETNADEKTVCEVLSRVTQFADYSNLDDMETAMKQNGVEAFQTGAMGVLSLANVFSYLTKKEQFMYSIECLITRKPMVSVIDNNLLDYVESTKANPFKNFLKEKLRESSLIIDGWNTKIDGKNMSYTMFGSEYDLQTITTSIVKEMQKTGKSLDDVLNGETYERCKKIMGKKFVPILIKSEKEPAYTAKEIAQRMKPKMPTKEQIEKFVEVYADTQSIPDLSKDEIKKLICKYLDVSFEPYSVVRMNSELKNMHKLIENKVKSLGKSMEDVVYIYPSYKNSFSLIAYQYGKVNNIPTESIKNIKEFGDFSLNQNKVYVVLDDVSASGQSLCDDFFLYSKVLKQIDYDEKTNIIFAPLYSTKIAKNYLKNNISSENRENIDYFLSPQVRDFHFNISDNFTQEEIKLLDKIVGGKGYEDIATSVVFPFCVTDSDTGLSALFSTFFVRYPNHSAISCKITKNKIFDTGLYFKLTRAIGSYNESNPKFL